MQVIRRASKRKSGLRFWNRAPGIKADMNTPHTRQPLTGVTLWGLVVGMALVFMGSVAFADTLPTPHCRNLPSDDHLAATNTAELAFISIASIDETAVTFTAVKGTADEGDMTLWYGKIDLPQLSAGALTVTAPAASVATAALCRRGSSQAIGSDLDTLHAEADRAKHTRIEGYEDAARTAASNATRDATLAGLEGATEADVRGYLTNAWNALDQIEEAWEREDDTPPNASEYTALGTAKEAIDTERDMTELTTFTASATALTNAASALNGAIGASGIGTLLTGNDAHQPFEITAQIGSGEEAYYVVISQEGDTALTGVGVTFSGIMAAAEEQAAFVLSDVGSQEETITLTTNVTGLLMADTSGRRVSGTLTETVSGDEVSRSVNASTTMIDMTAPLNTDISVTLTVTDEVKTGDGRVTLALQYAPAVAFPAADTTQTLMEGQTTYYFIDQTAAMIEMFTASQPNLATEKADTQGTLYSKDGQIAKSVDHTGGRNFFIDAPLAVGYYILAVMGDSPREKGEYQVARESKAVTGELTVSRTMIRDTEDPTNVVAGAEYYILQVGTPGWILVKVNPDVSGGPDDTNGVLTKDARTVAQDPNADAHVNFATEITMTGQYLLTITGADANEGYELEVILFEQMAFTRQAPTVTIPDAPDELAMACTDADFIHEDDVPAPQQCPSGGGGGGGGTRTVTREVPPSATSCAQYITASACEAELRVATDATGVLENPSGNGYRSGIGVISGWVCAANEVEIRIRDDRNRMVTRQQVGYGTSREDVQMAGVCQHDEETVGFGLTYNFNHLDEGAYTIAAYADGNTMIGEAQTFMVVHLEEFAMDDTDRFLRGLDGMCTVDDFPMASDVTTLVWEQSIQNFVIEAVEMMGEGGDTEASAQ